MDYLESAVETREFEEPDNGSLQKFRNEAIIDRLTYTFSKRLNGYTGEYFVDSERTFGFFYNPKTNSSVCVDVLHDSKMV